jgi:uncharacterized protein YecT (DUF1311 family)
MSDIFLSYGREDKATAAKLADSLERHGWSVFWDQEIPPGKTWVDVIGNELAQAAAVVVLWSKTSVAKRWVLKEARFADKRAVLIPAVIDDTEPPFEFGDIQAADLRGWHGDDAHFGYRLLTESIARAITSAKPQAASAEVASDIADLAAEVAQAGKPPPGHTREPSGPRAAEPPAQGPAQTQAAHSAPASSKPRTVMWAAVAVGVLAAGGIGFGLLRGTGDAPVKPLPVPSKVTGPEKPVEPVRPSVADGQSSPQPNQQAAAKPAPQRAFVTVTATEVRAEPSRQATVIDTIRAGKVVVPAGLAGGGTWQRLTLKDGSEGFIMATQLSPIVFPVDGGLPLFAYNTYSGLADALRERVHFEPSFNCANARSPQELMICSDAELAAADRDLSMAFVRAQRTSGYPDLPKSQTAWVKQRDDVCDADYADLGDQRQFRSVVNCLQEATRKRIDVLNQMSRGRAAD